METIGSQFVLFARLEMPYPLWLIALVVLPLVVRYLRRSLTRFSRLRQTVSLVCRVLLIVVLVLALCGPRIVMPSGRKFVVFAVDRSESVSNESRRMADDFLNRVVQTAATDEAAFLPFAGEPGAVTEALPDTTTGLNTRGTNLAAAIEAASAAIQPFYLPHIVLMTDGNQTDGDALAAARSADIPISTVPLESNSNPEVYVSEVTTEGQTRREEPFHVEVVLHSSHDDEGKLRLFRRQGPSSENRLADEQQVTVTAGWNRVRFIQSISGEQPAEFTARIEGFRDTLQENNTAACVVFATLRAGVLLVESESLLVRHLVAALKSERIDVETRRPDGIPASLAGLRQYGLLVLSNVPAASLSQAQMELMQTYVRDFGGGLIVIGGDQSFTPGGYRNTILEEMLPVWCEFDRQEESPSLAMALVIDRSGSMEEGGAIELAKEATRQAVNMLRDKDQVGVIAFQDTCRWVSPLGPCDDKQRVLEEIDTIRAGGGTNMYPAMERAYLALNEAFADLKHMIVLTDGVSHPGDFDALVERITASGITVSTVAVGRETVRPLLEDIARIGKGHSYFCDDAAAIPQIFTLETASAGKLGIIERPFHLRAKSTLPALAEIDFAAAPSLLGYVQTRAKPAGQLIMASESGDPVLIWWRYGLGMTVAFTSDVQSRWAAAWLGWPGFAPFWAQLARHAIRKDDESFLLEVDHQHATGMLSLEAVDSQGRFLNGGEARLEINRPSGSDTGWESRQLDLRQVAPGRYATSFSAPTPVPPRTGTYYLELSFKHDGQPAYVGRRGLVVGYADEFRTRPTDHDLLRSMAETTGGTYNPDPATVFASLGQTVNRTVFLWPYLLMTAMVIFLIDVTVRRFPSYHCSRN